MADIEKLKKLANENRRRIIDLASYQGLLMAPDMNKSKIQQQGESG